MNKQIPYKYRSFNYCPSCATELQYIVLEGYRRKKCPNCGFIHWGDYSLGVGGVILKNNKGLLIQRAHEPGRGKWTIPGGFVNSDEKISEAIVREIQEETGITAEPVSIIAVRDRPKDIPEQRHDIYIVFLLKYLAGELKPDPTEVMNAGFFSPEQYRELDIAPLSLQVVSKALAYQKQEIENPGFILEQNIPLSGKLSELYILP